MIYVHCGWPKTGTSSLQAGLAKNQGRLAEAGIVYPTRWRGGPASHGGSGGHNALNVFLKAPKGLDDVVDEVQKFLFRGKDVLLSSEMLTVWMMDRKRERLLKFFAALQQLSSVRCIWTLRRLDELACSLYRMRWRRGSTSISPDEFVRSFDFNPRGFQEVEEIVESAYVQYAADGRHNGELLGRFGIPADIRQGIESDIRTSPPLNTSLSHKQAVAIANVKVVSARIGIRLSRGDLLAAFQSDGFRFEGDRRWDPVHGAARRDLHERIVQTSRDGGFEPYLAFFEGAAIDDSASPDNMDPDVLWDGDLDRLAVHLRSAAGSE